MNSEGSETAIPGMKRLQTTPKTAGQMKLAKKNDITNNITVVIISAGCVMLICIF